MSVRYRKVFVRDRDSAGRGLIVFARNVFVENNVVGGHFEKGGGEEGRSKKSMLWFDHTTFGMWFVVINRDRFLCVSQILIFSLVSTI